MAYQKVSYLLTPEVKAALEANLDAINTEMMVFTSSLSLSERKTIQKMGNKTVAFVEQALKYAKKYPEFVPPYLELIEFERDFQMAEDMRNLLKVAEPIVEKIADTYVAAGADAFAHARIFYNAVKAASKANTPGADALVAELKKRYFRKKTTQPQDDEAKEEEKEEDPSK